jgi:hypothetical protein
MRQWFTVPTITFRCVRMKILTGTVTIAVERRGMGLVMHVKGLLKPTTPALAWETSPIWPTYHPCIRAEVIEGTWAHTGCCSEQAGSLSPFVP